MHTFCGNPEQNAAKCDAIEKTGNTCDYHSHVAIANDFSESPMTLDEWWNKVAE